MDVFFSLIIGCLSIGVLLSAPMGPIGILCVQRTLNNGRQSGLYTGIGAAISDLFYCMLTGFGLSIVMSWIEANMKLLEIIGSALLIAYALFMILHKPEPHHDSQVRAHGNQPSDTSGGIKGEVKKIQDWLARNERVRDVMTGFFLTLSNPLIIFLIIPLMARFSFPATEHSWFHIVLGFVFIVAGALLWWLVITWSVDKVRSRMTINIDSMWTINRVMGTILLIVAAYGLYDGTHEFINQLGVLPPLPTLN